MTHPAVTDQEILAFLDEMLPPDRSAQIEQLMREKNDLIHRAALLSRRRDQGGHSVGEIWRRRQLSCPSREILGARLLDIVEPDLEDYIVFHTQVVGCRICLANLEDLKQKQSTESDNQSRQKRYFESSAGLLRTQESPNRLIT